MGRLLRPILRRWNPAAVEAVGLVVASLACECGCASRKLDEGYCARALRGLEVLHELHSTTAQSEEMFDSSRPTPVRRPGPCLGYRKPVDPGGVWAQGDLAQVSGLDAAFRADGGGGQSR